MSAASLAQAMVDFMNSAPALPASFIYLAIAGIPVTLLHELGHALAARRLLGGEVRVSVGSSGRVAEMRLGQITASINAISSPTRPGGLAVFDASNAAAMDIVWIALAGPLASLLGALLTTWLYSSGPSSGAVHDFLWAALACGISGVLMNLIPINLQERRGGPTWRTDGRLAVDAFKLAHARSYDAG